MPKGTIEDGEASAQTAEREAFEEAGIIGSAVTKPVGHFEYEKESNGTQYHVTVHILSGSGLRSIFRKRSSGAALRSVAGQPAPLSSTAIIMSGPSMAGVISTLPPLSFGKAYLKAFVTTIRLIDQALLEETSSCGLLPSGRLVSHRAADRPTPAPAIPGCRRCRLRRKSEATAARTIRSSRAPALDRR
ncbi:NUDIX domain-containing protein [Rhizobium sp. CNPSo 3490]|nr:NUDIX domain-containing protein [Rhizobium sp. CNPSo 3490]MDK4732902.1 NUDIX domain-containing protein [Rhizobium sp. CNPSo 3490]